MGGFLEKTWQPACNATSNLYSWSPHTEGREGRRTSKCSQPQEPHRCRKWHPLVQDWKPVPMHVYTWTDTHFFVFYSWPPRLWRRCQISPDLTNMFGGLWAKKWEQNSWIPGSWTPRLGSSKQNPLSTRLDFVRFLRWFWASFGANILWDTYSRITCSLIYRIPWVSDSHLKST